MAETDYWVRIGDAGYGPNFSPWHYIKTKSESDDAPIFSSASVEGNKLTITFNEALAAAANLANSAFAVKKTPSGGMETDVSLSSTAPVISGSRVVLTLATAVAVTDGSVKVSYTKPTSDNNNRIEDAAGNETDSFSAQEVANDTPRTITIAADTSPITAGTNAFFTVTADVAPDSDTEVFVHLSETETIIKTPGPGPGLNSVTINADSRTATLSVATVDEIADADSGVVTARVQLVAGRYLLGSPSTTTVTVNNDDGAANNPATGTPAISGYPQVGQTLTAGTSGISDADGLTGVSYSYQWIRVDGTTETDISGATSSTYTLAAADSGKTIKVEVSFQDDNSNDEELTSTATGTVVAAAPACTTGNVWCATLTVGDGTRTSPRASQSGGYCSGIANTCTTAYGSLSDTTITLGGTTYTVRSIRWGKTGSPGDNLHLTLDSEFPSGRVGLLTLNVDSNSFALSSAADTSRAGEPDNNYKWTTIPSAIQGYEAGRQVTVELLAANPTITIAGGDAVTEGTAAEFTVTADAAPFSDLTVMLTVADLSGSDFVAAGDEGSKTVTINANETSATYSVDTVADSTEETSGDITVTVATGTGYNVGTSSSATVRVNDDDAPAANNPATGAPAISGYPQVGQTLTAGTSGISDADGLTGVSYSYQWIRVDGSTETDISSATSSTYTLAAADSGKTIKVKVSFQDDDSNDEELTSTPTGTVVAAAPACTAGNVWCATLTVGKNTRTTPAAKSLGYCSGLTNTCTTAYGSLSGTTITLGGTTYTVRSVRWGGPDSPGDNLHLTLDSEFPSGGVGLLTLNVDSNSFALSSAADTNRPNEPANNYKWTTIPSAIQGYEAGRQVTVELLAANPTITISGGDAVTEGTAAEFTVTADAAPFSDVTVDLTVADDEDSDFVAAANEGSKTVTINANETSATYSVATVADTTDEENGDVTVTVDSGTGYTVGSPASASVTVNDDDATDTAPAFSSAAADGDKLTITFSETLAAAANLSNDAFGVKKTPSSGTETGVSLSSTAPAISGSTVVLTLATAVVPTDGSIKVSYTKPPTGTDNRIEDAAGLETDSFTDQAVTNNTLPTITISGGSDVTEGTAAEFTVTAHAAPASNITVMLTVADLSGSDFVAAGDEGSKTVTINANETSATYSVATVDDSTEETSGDITVTVASGTGYNVGTSSSATVRVNDDDAPAANNPATGTPAISGYPQVGQTLTAGTSGISDADGLTGVSYSYQWIRVDGTTETDISGATSSTYTLAAADSGKTIKVEVSFQDDNSNDEELTSTATGTVVAAAPACTTGNVWCATLTVGDGTRTSPRASQSGGYCSGIANTCTTAYGSLSDTTITLGGTTYTVRSIRWGKTGSPGDNLHLTLDSEFPSGRVGLLTLNVDSNSFALSSAADTSRAGEPDNNYKWTTIPSAIQGYEAGRQVTVELLAANPTITISGGDAVTEGTAAGFTVTADAAPFSDLTVMLTVADDEDSDFVAAANEGSKTVTINANETSATYSVATVADTTDEENGDVTVTVASGTGYTVGSPASASVTVNDDDVTDTAPSFSSAAVVGDKLTITFSETLAAAANLSNDAFEVKKTPSGATETDVDLHATTGPAISGRTVVLTLATAVVPTDGSIKVSYTKPTTDNSNRIEDAAGLETDSFTDQAVTNNTVPTLTIAGGSTVTEGTAAEFTITAHAASASNITVMLTVADVSGSDFVASTNEGKQTVTLTAGDTSVTYSVDTVGDSTEETSGDITVTVASGTGYNVGTSSSATVRVNDDDAVTNSAPTVPNPIPNQGANVGRAFSFQFAANAFADADTGDTLTFSATQSDGTDLPDWLTFTASTRTFSGTPTATGTVSVEVTASDGNGGTVSDTFDITVAAALSITISGGTAVTEGTNAVFTVTASPAPAADLTVNLTVADADDSDFVAATNEGDKTVSITGGSTSATYSVATVGDSANEPNGDVTVTVKSGTGYSVGSASSDTVTVNDDDDNNDPSGSVTITGTATQGQQLTADASGVTDVDGVGTLSYQWNRGGTAITGATSSTYTLVQDDVGSTITVTVSYTDDGGTAESVDSAATGTVANVNDAPTVKNAISNQSVTVNTAFSFQFAANTFEDVDGDTLTYTAVESGETDLPDWLSFTAGTRTFSGTPTATGTVSVEVTASDGNGGTVSDTFDIEVAAAPVITIAPGTSPVTEGTAATFTVTANRAPSGNLTVKLTVSEAPGVDFVASGDEGSKAVTINSGSTTATYSVTTQADSANEPNGDVTVMVESGTGYTVGSTASASVTVNDNDDNNDPTGSVTITGTATQGQELTANTTGVADIDRLGTFSYQWKRGGTAISGATSSKYTLVQDDVGATITVTVSYTDGGGTAESLDSAATGTVANVNDAPTVANAISNQSATAGSAFTFQFAADAFEDVDGDTLTYTAVESGETDLPDWLTFTASTRTFSGRPAAAGTVSVEVTANDGNGGTVSDTFDITVAAPATPTITIAAGTSPVTEGTAASFTVTASPAPIANLTVNLTVADVSGSDFVASGNEGSQTVTINANTTSATYSVPTVADATDETSGSVTVTVTAGTGYTVGSTATAGVTVNDDDASGGTPTNVLVSTIGQAESAGQGNLSAFDLAQGFRTGSNANGYTLQSIDLDFRDTPVGVSVKLATGVSAGGTETVVATLNNPATLSSGVLTFTAPANTTLSARTVYFVVVAATSGIPLRTSSNAEDAGAAPGWRVNNNNFWRTSSAGSWQSGGHVYRIRVQGTTKAAPPTPTITIAAGTSPVTEGTAASFTVTASPAPSANLPVNLTVADADDSDFVAAGNEGSKTVTINANTTSATYSVATVDDTTNEDDGDVTVTVASGDGYTVGSTASASVTVNDDDEADTAPAFSSASVDGDKLTITFNEVLAAASNLDNDAFEVKKTPSGGSEATVNLSTSTAPAISGRTVVLTLATAVVPTDGSIKVSYTKPTTDNSNRIEDDAGLETDSFTDQAVTNNTVPTLTIAGGSAVTEGTAAEFTITAHAAPATNVTVNLTVADVSGSDFVASGNEGSQTVTLNADTTSATYSVPTVADTTDETSGSVTVTVASGDGYTVGSPASGTVTVNDDDGTDTAPSFSSAAVVGDKLTITFNEALAAAANLDNDAFSVKKTPSGGSEATVNLSTSTAPAISGSRVVLTLATAVVPTDGSIKVSYTKPTTDNSNRIEDDAGLETDSFTDQAVTNNTLPTITVAAGTSPVTEGTAAEFTVTSNAAASSAGLTVNLTVSESSNGDYVASADEGDKTVTISSGETTATYSVSTVGDTTDETNGSVTVTVKTGTGYTVGSDSAATVNVNDDDEPPNVAPVFTSQPTTATIPENSADDTAVQTGNPAVDLEVTATDANAADTIAYSLDTAAAKLFAIDSDGAITVDVDAGSALDHEASSSITVTVTATDSHGATANHNVTISITDENEPPTAPAKPTVTGASSTSVTVSWTAPDNDGKPDISGYDVEYRASGDTAWIDHSFTGTGTSTTISGLNPSTTYEVQVQASNDEGTSEESATGSGATLANVAPVFTSQPTTATIPENSADDTAVQTGNPAVDLEVTATDANAADTIAYSLDTAAAKLFAIDSDGAITVDVDAGSALDHEASSSITVTVTATDSHGATANHNVTISITDENEPPTAPAKPTVTGASSTSVTVSWTAPDNDGKPDISDYDVQYRASGDTDWIDHSFTGTGTSTTISGLSPSTTYEVQVLATNDEGTSEESTTGSGATLANVAPVFTSQPTTATIPENSADDTAVQTGTPAANLTVTATDANAADTIAYSLDTAAAKLFAIDSNGNITVDVASDSALDHEGTGGSIAATVTATDTHGATATHAVTISIADRDEPPTVAAPTVTGASISSLNVSWTPTNTGPPITGYAVRYRNPAQQADDQPLAWVSHSVTGTGTSTTISNLDAVTTYIVQVQATNDEGTGGWSPDGSGKTHDLTVSIAAGTTPVTEGTDASFTLTASPAPHADLIVTLRVTEKAGSDFVAAADQGAQVMTIPSGSATATYSVPTQDDSTDEPDGSVTVDMGGGTDYLIGSPNTATVVVNDNDDPPANPPVFTNQATTATVAENSADGTAVQTGDPAADLTITATDADGDTLSYSLDNASDLLFDIDSSGAITVQVEEDSALDHEASSSITATVTASDGTGTASHSVTISVTDELEAPDTPDTPTVTTASASSVTVSWAAPDTTGIPDISGYNVRYRAAGDTTWIDHSFTGTGTSTTIPGLSPSTTYEVQVQASNNEGTSEWSETGSGETGAAENIAPVFSSPPDSLDIAENSAGGATVGTVAATDADGDTLTYSLDSTSGAVFDIDSSGVITVASGATLDYEATPSYAAVVTVSDGAAAVSHSLTINVTDEDEVPDAPDAPTVTAASPNSVNVTWTAPDTSDRPAITDYDVRYKLSTETAWTDHSFIGTGIGTTISGLTPDSTYDVQVQATNADGTSGWSATGSGDTPANNAPVFADQAATASVAENSADGTAVVTITATDADAGDTLTYSLDSASDALFDIGSSSGAITVQVEEGSALDHEAAASITATVTATDSNNGTATHDVTISVTDELEPPDAPAAPTVTGASQTSVTVNWTAPANAGRPDITDYNVRFRASGATEWSDHSFTGANTGTTITGLTVGTTYEVQVQAANAEGTGGWSASGSGATNSPTNNAPVFTNQATTASVAENSADGTAVVTITATDADAGDTLTYSLDSASDAVFDIGSSSGAITVQVEEGSALDHEATARYTATVTASDGTANVTHSLTISVTNVAEPPDAPAAPTVTGASQTSVTVNWTAPANAGRPDITDYNVRFRASGATEWSDHSFTGANTGTTITGLSVGTTYEVQVQAANADGTGGWSASGSGATNSPTNNAPVFTNQATTASVAENSADGTAVVTITATDADGDTLSYSLDSASDAVFDIGSSSGAITVQVEEGSALDHEAAASITATVTATDSNNGTATHDVTISVTDELEPPDAPAAPTVTGASQTSVSVNWTAPANAGRPDITDYNVRFRASGATEWSDHSFTGANTGTTITGLTAGTTYEVQVQAANAEGTGGWSASGSGATGMAPPPVAGQVSGSTVTLEFDEPLDAQSVPDPEDFTVTVTPQVYSVTAVSIEGSTLSLTVSPPVPAGQSVTVSYARGAKPLSTAAGLRVQEFTQTLSAATAPEFDGEPAVMLTVAENSAAGTLLGTVSATDADGDTPSYSLTSPDGDHESFAIDGEGRIRVADGAVLDFEARSQYAFTAEVTDGEDADGNAEDTPTVDDTIGVTVTLTNVEEPPGEPTGLTVSAASSTSLAVSWTAPEDAGARLDGYGVQYRAAGETQWADHPHSGTATRTTIGDLLAGTAYEVRVRSLGDGDSDWTVAEGSTAVAAPTVVGALPDLTLVAGAAVAEVDAAAVFTGRELVYVYTSSDASVASFEGAGTVTLDVGEAARLQGESAGEARITVTASNSGGSASVAFTVTVKAVSDEEAEALGLSLDGLTRTLLSGATGVIGARMAASETVAPSLQGLNMADASAALARLFGLPAAAPGTAAPGYALGTGSAAAGSPWTGAVPGPATGHGFATGHGAAADGGQAFRTGLPADGMLRSRGDLRSDTGPAGFASGGLWNRSFAFSIEPVGEQTLAGAQASGSGQSPGGAPTSGNGPALPRWTVWGAGDVQRFSGGEGAHRYDGDWRTAYLGTDRRFGERWLGGVAVARGKGEAGYRFGGAAAGDGRLQTDLTAVYPYLKGVIGDGVELWATLGAGTGEAMNVRGLRQGIVHDGDLRMRLAAAGLRSAMTENETMRLSLLADVGTATLDIDGEGSLADLQSTADRARVGMELSRKGAWSPYVQLSGRYDGDESVSDIGYEVESGLLRSGARVDFELRGRWMALSGDADYEESGATAILRIKACPDGTGFSASLSPAWGRPGGMDLVWSQGPMPAMQQPWAGDDMGMTLNAELGYGIESWRLRGLITPMLGYGRGAAGDGLLQLGADYGAKPKWLPVQLGIGFGLQRQMTLEGPVWGGELRALMRW